MKYAIILAILCTHTVIVTQEMDITTADKTVSCFNSPSAQELRRASLVVQSLEAAIPDQKVMPLPELNKNSVNRLHSFIKSTKDKSRKKVKEIVKQKAQDADLPTLATYHNMFDYLQMPDYVSGITDNEVEKLTQDETWQRFIQNPELFDVWQPRAEEDLKHELYKRIDLPRLFGGAPVKERKIKTKQFVKKIAFSEDENRVYGIGQHDLLVWKSKNGKRVTKITIADTITDMSVCRDDRVLIGTDTGKIIFCDPKTKTMVERLAHDTSIVQVASSPDNIFSASASNNGQIKIWHKNGQCVHTITLNDSDQPITRLAFSQDGTHVAAGNQQGAAGVWEVQTGQLKKNMHDFNTPVTDVAFSKAGNNILIASAVGAHVNIYPLHKPGISHAWSGSSRLHHLAASQDLKKIFCESNTQSLILSFADDHGVIETKINQTDSASFSNDNEVVVVGSGSQDTMNIIDAQHGLPIKIRTGGKIVDIGKKTNRILSELYGDTIGIYDINRLLDAQKEVKQLSLKHYFLVKHLIDSPHKNVLSKKDTLYPLFTALPKTIQQLLIDNKKVTLK